LNGIYPDSSHPALQVLHILRTLAFVSLRFGYAAFDEWNFVYLASVDILAAHPRQAAIFVENNISGTPPEKLMRHSDNTSCGQRR
jgi:hypothetical protein